MDGADTERRPGCAVVVPIRSFQRAKQRLTAVLDDAERVQLVRRLAITVLDAAGDRPVAVVTSDPEVAALAHDRGHVVLADPGSLDAAAHAGRTWARTTDRARVAVVHADLPRARDLACLDAAGHPGAAVLVADQRGDGTPALSIPVDVDFAFAYGPGSYERHRGRALALGLDVITPDDRALGFDVDLPADLLALDQPDQERA